jgi:glycosyltransferase involved in cell wall biosynthesis
MSAYNADATMARSVASVLAQSYADFELIIVDDGSRDGSAGMARLLAIEDRRIRTLRQAHAGTASARNRGIAAATGEYLAFLGAGDLWSRTRLARHLAVMESAPECGVTLEAHDETAGLFAHRAVFAEAGPFNADLADGDECEWLARVQDLTDWQVARLEAATPARPVLAGGRMPAPPLAAAALPAPRARRFGGLAAFFGAPRRQVLAG